MGWQIIISHSIYWILHRRLEVLMASVSQHKVASYDAGC